MCALVGVCLSPQLDAVRESVTRQVYLYRLAHELCNCRRIHRHTIDSETTCSIKVTAPAALHNRVSDPGPTECSGSFLCKESVIESSTADLCFVVGAGAGIGGKVQTEAKYLSIKGILLTQAHQRSRLPSFLRESFS